jgi:sugar phosphate isomerase/epimerase
VTDPQKLNRRTFLAELAAAGATGTLLAACAHASSAAGAAGGSVKPSADRIGVQLYTVRDLLQQDFEGTITKVAQLGYKQLEFAGYYDRTPQQVRALLDKLGVASPSTHIGVNLLRQDAAAQIASAKTIGQAYITVPSYPYGRDGGLDAYKTAAAEFNKWAAMCRDAGIRLAYHNHDAELRPINGGTYGLDVLMHETDPSLVDFELDLYWAVHAGADPLALFDKYPGRFAMWHVKDMVDPQGTKAMTAVGQGTIDFPKIFAQASKSGMRYFFVEHDSAAQYPGGSLASLQTSVTNLKRMLSA